MRHFTFKCDANVGVAPHQSLVGRSFMLSVALVVRVELFRWEFAILPTGLEFQVTEIAFSFYLGELCDLAPWEIPPSGLHIY